MSMRNRKERLTAVITDHRLAEVTSHAAIGRAEAEGRRIYVALWADGDRTFFAVASAEHARAYASEYGIRLRGGERPLRVVWNR